VKSELAWHAHTSCGTMDPPIRPSSNHRGHRPLDTQTNTESGKTYGDTQHTRHKTPDSERATPHRQGCQSAAHERVNWLGSVSRSIDAGAVRRAQIFRAGFLCSSDACLLYHIAVVPHRTGDIDNGERDTHHNRREIGRRILTQITITLPTDHRMSCVR